MYIYKNANIYLQPPWAVGKKPQDAIGPKAAAAEVFFSDSARPVLSGYAHLLQPNNILMQDHNLDKLTA